MNQMTPRKTLALTLLLALFGFATVWWFAAPQLGRSGGSDVNEVSVAPQNHAQHGVEEPKSVLSTESSPIASREAAFPSLDSARQVWVKAYDRGLGSAVAEARDSATPERAYELAEALNQCLHVDMQMARERQALLSAKTASDRDASSRSLAFLNR